MIKMQDIIVGFALGMVFYHILLKKILVEKEKSKFARVLDIIKEKKEKPKKDEK